MKTIILITTVMIKFSFLSIEEKETCDDIKYVYEVKDSLKEEYRSNLMSEDEFKQEWDKWDELHMHMYFKLFSSAFKIYDELNLTN